MALHPTTLFPNRLKIKRPSNNPQPIFSSPDPFRRKMQVPALPQARNRPLRMAATATTATAPAPELAPGQAVPISSVDALRMLQQGDPTGEAQNVLRMVAGLPPLPATTAAPTTPVAATTPGGVPAQPFPLSSIDALRMLQQGDPTGEAQNVLRSVAGLPPLPAGTTEPAPPVVPGAPGAPDTESNPVAEAAMLLSGTVAGNPFVSESGKRKLAAGLIPNLNDINPAFFRFTDPVTTQSLLALFQSNPAAPVTPEQAAFTFRQFRHKGFR